MTQHTSPIEFPVQVSTVDMSSFDNSSWSRRDIETWLNNQVLSADAKAILSDIAALTARVGDRILQVGRKVLTIIAALVSAYPSTAFGIVVGAALALLISIIPIMGPILASVFGPLLVALGLAKGALTDFQSRLANERLDQLEREFALLKP